MMNAISTWLDCQTSTAPSSDVYNSPLVVQARASTPKNNIYRKMNPPTEASIDRSIASSMPQFDHSDPRSQCSRVLPLLFAISWGMRNYELVTSYLVFQKKLSPCPGEVVHAPGLHKVPHPDDMRHEHTCNVPKLSIWKSYHCLIPLPFVAACWWHCFYVVRCHIFRQMAKSSTWNRSFLTVDYDWALFNNDESHRNIQFFRQPCNKFGAFLDNPWGFFRLNQLRPAKNTTKKKIIYLGLVLPWVMCDSSGLAADYHLNQGSARTLEIICQAHPHMENSI